MLLILFTIISAWVAWKTTNLLKYRNIAKSTGLPYIVSPFGSHDPIWILFQRFLRPALEKLPFGMGAWVKYMVRGWNWYDKAKSHEELGKVFMLVTPSGNDLYIADAAASDSVLSRRKDFIKPLEMMEAVNLFGQSVATVDGQDWQRHRRITAPPFNERNSGLVWMESIRQAEQMLEHWNEKKEGANVNTVPHDTAKLALHVLTGAGFGMTYSFRSSLDTPRDGYRLTYRDSLEIAIGDVVLLILVPAIVYSLPWLPKKLANYKMAVEEFKRYLREMVAAAKLRALEGGPVEPDLLNTLVQKSQEADTGEDADNSNSKNGLSDDEIYGNLFMFSFAGHETTASALAYAIYLFAALPEWQEWVGAEVDEVFKGHDSINTLNYEELYPKLKRCGAIMYEVLRLYPPVLSVPKCTGNVPATIKVENREVTVPPNTDVYPNIIGLHTTVEYWGDDCLTWQPSRWIKSTSKSLTAPATKELLESETPVTPVKGSYIPWADGPRICPGKKFAQVEFVAVIAVLLWRHRVSINPQEGESLEQARKRVSQVIEDSGTKLTLQMRRPETVDLVFIEK